MIGVLSMIEAILHRRKMMDDPEYRKKYQDAEDAKVEKGYQVDKKIAKPCAPAKPKTRSKAWSPFDY